MNLLCFRCGNSFLAPLWNRNYVASVQVALPGNPGAAGSRGLPRDRWLPAGHGSNRLFQVVALLAMEAS